MFSTLYINFVTLICSGKTSKTSAINFIKVLFGTSTTLCKPSETCAVNFVKITLGKPSESRAVNFVKISFVKSMSVNFIEVPFSKGEPTHCIVSSLFLWVEDAFQTVFSFGAKFSAPALTWVLRRKGRAGNPCNDD